MSLVAYALSRAILVGAVMLTMLFAVNELYLIACALLLTLAAYGYLLISGRTRFEDPYVHQ